MATQQQRFNAAQEKAVDKDRRKNQARIDLKNEILKWWPNGDVPASRDAWEKRLGRPLIKWEKEAWNAYVNADGAYKTAAKEAEKANEELAAALAPLGPNDYGGTDWDADSPRPGYVGKFHARSQVRTGEVSWADVDPPPDLMNEPVEKIDLKRALSLAAGIDRDIDGKHAGGTSALKEGEERFTIGASYAGTQGISINEISGLSASYVHGKRVTWLEGDTWSYQEGGWSVSSVKVKESRSTTTVDKDQVADVKVKGHSTANTAAGSLTRSSISDTFINTQNTAKACINTFTAAPTIHSLTTSIETTTLNMTGSTLALAMSTAVRASVTVAGRISITTLGCLLENHNIAPIKQGWDHTDVSAQIYDNVGISVQGVRMDATKKNSVQIAENFLAQNNIKVESTSQKLAALKYEIEKLTTSVRQVGQSMENADVRIAGIETQFGTGGTQVQSIRNSICRNNSTIFASSKSIFM